MKTVTPQALVIEINKHESYMALVESGILKLGKAAKNKRLSYIKDLKQQLNDLTDIGDNYDTLSDEELLKDLFS